MSTGTLAALAALAGAALAALVNYLVSARKLSGKIATTDADKLWEASETLRRDMRDEMDSLRKRLREADDEIANLKRQIAVLERRLEGVENGR